MKCEKCGHDEFMQDIQAVDYFTIKGGLLTRVHAEFYEYAGDAVCAQCQTDHTKEIEKLRRDQNSIP